MADTTYMVHCPCGECDNEVVELTFSGGFASTSALLTACGTRREDGIVSMTIRKSAGLALRRAD